MSGITVLKVPNVWEEDYLIRLSDKDSSILQKPYIFQFMVHNRRPALYLINRTVGGQTYVNDFVVCASWTVNLEPIAAVVRLDGTQLSIENAAPCDSPDPLNDPEEIDIELEAQDPDDDELAFFFDYGTPDGMARMELTSQNVWPEDIQTIQNMAEKPLFVNVTVKDAAYTDYQFLRFRVTNKAQT